MELEAVRELEAVAANAWPAEIVETLDGWRLRYTRGVTRRANSVLPLEDSGRIPLEERLERVEAFYGVRNAPAIYQVSPAAAPPELDEALEARGYTAEGRTCIETAPVETVLARTQRGAEHGVHIAERLPEAWFALYARSGQYSPERAAVRRGILERIAAPRCFVLICLEGEPASVGLGVAEREWVGVFAMATEPRFRRRGAAACVLHVLAEWARRRGARRMYLQVAEENLAARALYLRAGFETAYCYHYRRQPPASSGAGPALPPSERRDA